MAAEKEIKMVSLWDDHRKLSRKLRFKKKNGKF